MKKLIISFKHAVNGIYLCIKTCRNFRIHTVAAGAVLYFSRFYNFDSVAYSVLIATIAAVISCECINSAVEQTCNAADSGYNIYIKAAKDMAAGAVLICAVFSVVIGVFLFWNKSVFSDIVRYFSSPLRLVCLIAVAVLCLIYIFYEDIFLHEKK